MPVGNFAINRFYYRSKIVNSIVLLLILTPQQAFSTLSRQHDAMQLMSEMMQAMKSHKYQGTLILYRNGNVDAMKYFHSVDNGEEQERFLGLNSPMREVIRAKDKVICIFPDKKQVIIDHRLAQGSFFLEFPDDFSGMDQFYGFKLLGIEKIAMMDSRIVNIQPKDEYRYARKVWISQQNKLPLKYELHNLDGTVIEQAAFTEIKIDDQLPIRDLSEINNLGMRVRHIHKLKNLPFDQASFDLQNRPEGFDTIFFTRRKMHDTEIYVEHLQLSDGFSSVSVYFEQGGHSSEETGYKAIGSINSYTRNINDYQVTVMGQVPAKTVQFIAQGIQLKKNNPGIKK